MEKPGKPEVGMLAVEGRALREKLFKETAALESRAAGEQNVMGEEGC